MNSVPSPGQARRPAQPATWIFLLLGLWFQACPGPVQAALPKRLVLLVDGVAYRDMRALQAGVTYQDRRGRTCHRQAFHQGYFPVNRNVSTFPSVSDVAWTDILGGQPLPGYQRTYFSAADNAEHFINGVTTSMEYEQQMTWQMAGGFRRVLGYIAPLRAFKYEVNQLTERFLNSQSGNENYYALIHSTDVAQHLSGDIFAMLSMLDLQLQELRRRYRAREGRDLEILILSDHGNNHAGAGQRVAIRGFLKKAGYRITKSLQKPGDIVLPTAGIESWVEIHNAPAETERLVQLLPHLKGVDVVTAKLPGRTNQFIVVNSKSEQAYIEWRPAQDTFRYSCGEGDPIGYRPVIDALAGKGLLDPDGFAHADAWMAETLAHRYPLALERIVRGHTQVTLNPASILISLDNDHVHCGWLIKRGIALVKSGGTHGALDDLNSNGIVLSNFSVNRDTSTSRVAALFGGFPDLGDPSASVGISHRGDTPGLGRRGLASQAAKGRARGEARN